MLRRSILGISTIFDPDMKKFFLICPTLLALCCLAFCAGAQVRDTSVPAADTTILPKKERDTNKTRRQRPTVPITIKDTGASIQQEDDTLPPQSEFNDNSNLSSADQETQRPILELPIPIQEPLIPDTMAADIDDWLGNTATMRLLKANPYLKIDAQPLNLITEERQSNGKELLFYFLCGLILYAGMLKVTNPAYFANLFRVFFNTSLRQSQLTEQLIQARWPSFLYNLLFVLSGGTFIWLLLLHFEDTEGVHKIQLLLICVGMLIAVYLLKFIFLKFLGWAADIGAAINNYIFVIFLINKILGIILLPFNVLLAFALPGWLYPLSVIALLTSGILFLSRYIKGYGLTYQRLFIRPLHFILYILVAEIFPVWILYKAVTDYFL